MSAGYWAPVRVNPALGHPAERRLSLGGRWQFRLDPEDRSLAERWFGAPHLFHEAIDVPLALDPLGLNIADPAIRVMYSYPVGHSLAYLAELRVGQGGLVVSALNLDQGFVEARYLLAQIGACASSSDFTAAPE